MDIIRRSWTVRKTPAPAQATGAVSGKDIRTEGAASQSIPVGERDPLRLSETQKARLRSPFARPLVRGYERQAVAVLLLVFLFNAWLLNATIHADWLPVLIDELRWVVHPRFAVPDVHPSLSAIIAFLQIFTVGTLASAVVLPGEKDMGVRRLVAVGLGLALVGWATMILGIVGRLDRITVNIAVFLLICALLYLQFIRERLSPRRVLSNLQEAFGIWALTRPRLGDLAFFGALVAIAAAVYYQATTTPILHWDALVYHAAMAKLMFQAHGIPVIAGPSVGIEMSANYPPLFPALGAFFYAQVGAVDDVYLRLISPTAGLLTTLTIYKTACQLGGLRFARLATLLLALAPLFIVTSVFAINYMLAVFFVSATLFFLVRVMIDGKLQYWAAAGIMYGMAFSTTYQAYFFIPAFGIALGLAARTPPNRDRKGVVLKILAAGIMTLGIGGVWYLRNLVVVGNPIFPFAAGLLGGKNIDLDLLARSVEGIHTDSLYNFFGSFDLNPLDLPRFVFLNKSHFPVLSLITLPGLYLALRQKDRAPWLVVLAFGLVPLLIVSSTVANIFPRYFIFSFPGLALVSALPLARALDFLRPESPSHSPLPRSRTLPLDTAGFVIPRSPAGGREGGTRMGSRWGMGALLGFMILTAIFPASLALFSGQAYQEDDWQPPYNPLLFLEHPNQEQWQALTAYFGADPAMWQWLNQHLGSDQVATFENKIYYIDSSDALFYLDGWEARDLYAMADPAAIVTFLAQHGVRYVLDPSWIRHWAVYNVLPLDHFLGMPQYFPILQGTPNDIAIYQVGRLDNPVTFRSSLALSYQPSDLSASSDNTRTFWRIPKGSESPRLFVETPANADKISVEIDYTANGNGTVTVNQQTAIGWAYGTAIGDLKGSQPQTLRFSIPGDKERGYVELGLYATSADVFISGIRAKLGQ